jgi:type IV secretory pathway VirB9-like protein
MNSSIFIPVNVIKDDGTTVLRFINSQHIIQIYEENEIIYMELTEYTVYKVDTPNIHMFMDRFKH